MTLYSVTVTLHNQNIVGFRIHSLLLSLPQSVVTDSVKVKITVTIAVTEILDCGSSCMNKSTQLSNKKKKFGFAASQIEHKVTVIATHFINSDRDCFNDY